VFVSLEHFREVVVGSVDWNFGLDQDFHGAHDIGSAVVVEGNFSLDVFVQLETLCCLSHHDWLGVSDGHVLCEWNTACFLDKSA